VPTIVGFSQLKIRVFSFLVDFSAISNYRINAWVIEVDFVAIANYGRFSHA
jgi:hypothetical protein